MLQWDSVKKKYTTRIIPVIKPISEEKIFKAKCIEKFEYENKYVCVYELTNEHCCSITCSNYGCTILNISMKNSNDDDNNNNQNNNLILGYSNILEYILNSSNIYNKKYCIPKQNYIGGNIFNDGPNQKISKETFTTLSYGNIIKNEKYSAIEIIFYIENIEKKPSKATHVRETSKLSIYVRMLLTNNNDIIIEYKACNIGTTPTAIALYHNLFWNLNDHNPKYTINDYIPVEDVENENGNNNNNNSNNGDGVLITTEDIKYESVGDAPIGKHYLYMPRCTRYAPTKFDKNKCVICNEFFTTKNLPVHRTICKKIETIKLQHNNKTDEQVQIKNILKNYKLPDIDNSINHLIVSGQLYDVKDTACQKKSDKLQILAHIAIVKTFICLFA